MINQWALVWIILLIEVFPFLVNTAPVRNQILRVFPSSLSSFIIWHLDIVEISLHSDCWQEKGSTNPAFLYRTSVYTDFTCDIPGPVWVWVCVADNWPYICQSFVIVYSTCSSLSFLTIDLWSFCTCFSLFYNLCTNNKEAAVLSHVTYVTYPLYQPCLLLWYHFKQSTK